MPRSRSQALWTPAAQGLGEAGPQARRNRAWLADPGSMTVKLKARTQAFTVRLLRQRPAPVLADEHAALGVPARSRVVERDVILHCDGQPVVFGHTVLSNASVKSDWPFFSKLGSTPLGANLFFDPLVRRSPIQYARLLPCHPLVRRIALALGEATLPPVLHARRSLFMRRGGVLMVTDVFLPGLGALMRTDVPAQLVRI